MSNKLLQTKRAIKDRNYYKKNRNKRLEYWKIRGKIATARSHYLRSLPVEDLLKEVGWYD